MRMESHGCLPEANVIISPLSLETSKVNTIVNIYYQQKLHSNESVKIFHVPCYILQRKMC